MEGSQLKYATGVCRSEDDYGTEEAHVNENHPQKLSVFEKAVAADKEEKRVRHSLLNLQSLPSDFSDGPARAIHFQLWTICSGKYSVDLLTNSFRPEWKAGSGG